MRSQVAVEIARPRSPYEALLRDIVPGHDDFPGEKVAAEIAGHLKNLSLPLAPDFHGASPIPVRHVPLAEGVSRAEFNPDDTTFDLKSWHASLGEIRAIRFFVLPGRRPRCRHPT